MLTPMDRDMLIGRTWEVIEIGDEPVTMERLPSIEFSDDGRVAGTTGVNRLMGGFELDGTTLHLSHLATTMMAGLPEAMKTEARLVQAFGGGGDVELQLLVRNPETGDTVLLRAAAPHPEPLAEESSAVPASEAEATTSESVESSDTAPAPLATQLPQAQRVAPGSGTLRGTVLYRERIAMPIGAVVMVRLLDTSRADAPAEVIGQDLITDPVNVPVAFEIGYDPSQINASHSYAAAAQIVVDGQVAWRSTMHHPVLTRGSGDSATIMVARVGR